jgi:hypothetical protein
LHAPLIEVFCQVAVGVMVGLETWTMMINHVW